MHIESQHQFLVEVLREDGELLAQDMLDELDFLADEARFRLASQFGLPDEPTCLTARLRPQYDGEQSGQVIGICVQLQHTRRADAEREFAFPAAIARPRGAELARDLVAEGRLAAGDLYRCRLAAVPRRPRGAASKLDWVDDESQVEEQAFPVVHRELAEFGIDEQAIAAADRRRPVFVARRVVEQAIAAAIAHANLETGTLLLGHLVDDAALRAAGCSTSWAVVVSEQMPVPGEATAASFVFPPESFRQARELAALRGRGELVVGSQHSHGWRCAQCDRACEIRNLFFSTDDVQMAGLFPIWAAFLVVGGDPARDRDRPVANSYVRWDGTMQAVPFGLFGP